MWLKVVHGSIQFIIFTLGTVCCKTVATLLHYSELSRCRRTAFLWAPFSILRTSRSRRELCRDCTEAGETVQSCVSRKIAAQGSLNALAHYRGGEASHRLTRNVVSSYDVTQSFQNFNAIFFVDRLTSWSKFVVHNTLTIKKNNQHWLDMAPTSTRHL